MISVCGAHASVPSERCASLRAVAKKTPKVRLTPSTSLSTSSTRRTVRCPKPAADKVKPVAWKVVDTIDIAAFNKDLEPGKWAKLNGWGDVDESKRIIVECIERAKKVGF